MLLEVPLSGWDTRLGGSPCVWTSPWSSDSRVAELWFGLIQQDNSFHLSCCASQGCLLSVSEKEKKESARSWQLHSKLHSVTYGGSKSQQLLLLERQNALL